LGENVTTAWTTYIILAFLPGFAQEVKGILQISGNGAGLV